MIHKKTMSEKRTVLLVVNIKITKKKNIEIILIILYLLVPVILKNNTKGNIKN